MSTRHPVPFLEVVFAFFKFFFEHSAHDQQLLRRLYLSLFLQAWCLPCAHLDMYISLDPATELNFRLNKGAASGQQAASI